jgi:hypothetical protein
MSFEDDAALRRLWASVIIQSLIDATAIPHTPVAAAHKRQARAWLSIEYGTTAQNFEEVCLAADIEPSRVRNFFKSYDGPPLTLHVLSRMRDTFLKGNVSANNHRHDPDS